MEDADFEVKVEAMLNGILSNDSAIHKQSEFSLLQLRSSCPNPLVVCLVSIVKSHTNASLRILAAVIIRQFCTAFSSISVWKDLAVQTKELIKDGLLESLSSEATGAVKANISEAVSEVLMMACREQKTCRVVLNLLIQWTGSQNYTLVELALHVLVKVSTLYAEEVYSKKETLLQLFAFALTQPSAELRSKATSALCSLVSSLESTKAHEFQLLLDLVLKVQLDLLRTDEEVGRKGVSHLIELAESEPQFFAGRLQTIYDLVQQIHSDSALHFDSERLALELTVTLLERLEDTDDKRALGEGLIKVLFESIIKTETEVDSQWSLAAEVDGEDEEYIESAKLVGRIVEFSGTADYLVELLQLYLAEPQDWRKPYSALLVLAEVSLPESAIVTKVADDLPKYTGSAVHPKVRFAAFYFIRQQCAESQEDFTIPHHSALLSLFGAGCIDSVPRVVSICCEAITRFVENSTGCSDQNYSVKLLSHLIPLLNHDRSTVVLEQALKAVNEIALLAPKSYALGYDYLLLPLCSLLQQFRGSRHYQIKRLALECLMQLLSAVGKKGCAPHLIQVVELLRSLRDETLREELMSAWQRLCRLLQKDFAPYLSELVPSLLQVLKAQELESSVEDKETALQTLATVVDDMQELYVPYLQGTLPLALENLVSENENTRTAAAVLAGSVVKLYCKVWPESDAQMAAIMLKEVWGVCSKEVDSEALCAQLEALQAVLLSSRPFLNDGLVYSFGLKLFGLYSQFELWLGSDSEDSEGDYVTTKQQESEQVKLMIAEVLGALLRSHTTQANSLLHHLLEAVMRKYLTPDTSDTDNCFALSLMDEIASCFGASVLLQYFPTLYEALLALCLDESDVLRQYAFRCLATLTAKTDPTYFSRWAPAVVETIERALKIPVTVSVKKHGMAYDGAVTALGCVIKHQEQCVDINVLLPAWIGLLPLKHSKADAQAMHDFLVDVLLANYTSLFESRVQLMPKILQLFSSVLDTKFLAEQSAPKVAKFVQKIYQRSANWFTSLCSGLREVEKQRIVRLILK